MSDFKKMQIKRKHLLEDRKKRQNERLKKLTKAVGLNWKTDEDIRRELEYEKDEIYRKIPKEKKQQFLDNIHAGMNMGDAGAAVGLIFDQYFEIFRRHMETGYLGVAKKVKDET